MPARPDEPGIGERSTKPQLWYTLITARTRLLACLSGFLLLPLLFLLSAHAQRNRTFTGEITDRDCAEIGGHMIMLQKGETARDCTHICVKLGSKYVLFSAEDKAVYDLDDQNRPEPFAGAKVKVTGTLDRDNRTIHVIEISSAS